MNPVIIGDAVLYHGNALEILPTLKESADLIFSDVPYLLTSGGAAPPGSIAEWQIAEDYNNSGELIPCDLEFNDFMPLFYGALRGDSHCYCMINNRNVQGMLNSAEKAGFRFHNLCVWNKVTCTPNRFYAKNLEFISFHYKGAAKYINDMSAKQLITFNQDKYGSHPCSKPVPLCQYFIEQSSQEGQTVLDPFMGSGATILAAIKSGRKAIGIELEERWFDSTVERIRKYYEDPKQIAMF